MRLDNILIIGISIDTTNENDQSTQDLGLLWHRFISEMIGDKISNKSSTDVYSIYTDYETDYRGKYISILGYRVKSLDTIPDGLIGFEIPKGNYDRFVARGSMPEALIKIWREIWNNQTLKRSYTTDFEIHRETVGENVESEVEIFVSCKN